MKKQFGIISFLLLIVLFSSCGKSKEQIENEKYEAQEKKTEQIKMINEKAIINLSKRYKSISGWDTLNKFTYELQEMFIDKGELISFKGKLKDILKLDSTYFLNVKNNTEGPHYGYNFIAQIAINIEMLKELKQILLSKDYTKEGCFVFRVSKIYTAFPKLKSDNDTDSEDSYLGWDFNTLIVFKGELIDFYMEKRTEYDE
jgi:hypothetical protein